KVIHKLRLANSSKYPLTTAPALLVRDGKVLGQGLMTYTASGGAAELTVTTAVDVQAKRTDREIKRTPNAHEESGVSYSRIDLSGKISLVSHHSKPIEIEVARYVLGTVDRVDHDAKIEKLNPFENGEYLATTDLPMWWSWYNWPSG